MPSLINDTVTCEHPVSAWLNAEDKLSTACKLCGKVFKHIIPGSLTDVQPNATLGGKPIVVRMPNGMGTRTFSEEQMEALDIPAFIRRRRVKAWGEPKGVQQS